MVLERVLLEETQPLKFSVKVVSHEPTWNAYGTITLPHRLTRRTLADPSNKGKLDRDEFAVALHLVPPHSTSP
jgi:hypothetical protein